MKLNCCKVKKTWNWKDNDCSPEISTFFTGPRMKTNSQRDGDVCWEENGTKNRRESKLLEIFCFLSSKYWAERGEGGVMVITAGTWYLTCDTQHYTGPSPRPGLDTVSVTRVTRDRVGTCHQNWKKIQNLIRVHHDFLFMMKCVTCDVWSRSVYFTLYKSLLLILWYSVSMRALCFTLL